MKIQQSRLSLKKSSANLSVSIVTGYYWLALYYHEHTTENPYGLSIPASVEQPIYGSLGTKLGLHLVHLFGYTAYFAPLFLVFAWAYSSRIKSKTIRLTSTTLVSMLCCLASLLLSGLTNPPLPDQGFSLAGEGLFGEWLIAFLSPLIGEPGLIALTALSVAALIPGFSNIRPDKLQSSQKHKNSFP